MLDLPSPLKEAPKLKREALKVDDSKYSRDIHGLYVLKRDAVG